MGILDRQVGIERLHVYPGSLSLPMEELCRGRELDLDFVRGELMIDERSLNPPWEDPVSLAVNAAKPIVERIDPNEIGLMVVASESGVDLEKPISAWVHRYLGLGSHCRHFEAKFACYGATGVMQLILAWLASGMAEGRKALLINSDQSLLALGQGHEPVAGAAAVAVLLSCEPRLVAYDLGRCGTYTAESYDVFRPTPQIEMGNSQMSLMYYLDALEAAYSAYAANNAEQRDFDQCFDWNVYHMPFPAMAERAHRTLLTASSSVSRREAAAHYRSAVAPSTKFARRMSGTYGGSTFIGLLGIAEAPTAKADDRIGIFAYGSGSCADYYSARLAPEALAVAGEASLEPALNARRRVSLKAYEAIERDRFEAALASDHEPRVELCEDWYAAHYEGAELLVLEGIENYHRRYRWS